MGRKNWTSAKIFDRLMNNKSQKTYWDNIAELRKRKTEDIYNKAFKLAKSKNNKNKIIGIDILAQFGFNPRIRQKETINLYFEILECKPNDAILFALFFAISHNNKNLAKKQVIKLTEFKNSENKDIRYSLVSALSGIDDLLAIETLIELSKDKFSLIRNWATFGIGTLSDLNNNQIITALWLRTKDKHQETKLEAILGLANRNQVLVKQQIIQELKNGEFGILLFDAVKALNDKDLIPYLEYNLKSAKNDSGIKEVWITDLKACLRTLKT